MLLVFFLKSSHLVDLATVLEPIINVKDLQGM
jgi:hypothetical protein